MNYRIAAVATVLSSLSTWSGVTAQTWTNPFGTGVQVVGGRSNSYSQPTANNAYYANMQTGGVQQQPASGAYGGYQGAVAQQAPKRPWYSWLSPKKQQTNPYALTASPAGVTAGSSWMASQPSPLARTNSYNPSGGYGYNQQQAASSQSMSNLGAGYPTSNAMTTGGMSAFDLPDMGAPDSMDPTSAYTPAAASSSAFGGYGQQAAASSAFGGYGQQSSDDFARMAALARLGVRQSSYSGQGSGTYSPYGASTQMGASSGGYSPYAASTQMGASSGGYSPYGASTQMGASSGAYSPYGASTYNPSGASGYDGLLDLPGI